MMETKYQKGLKEARKIKRQQRLEAEGNRGK